ncbi:glycerol dehydrogenase [Anaeramoeba flamelloides]|uniref:Glycerol dehydrogenase n=1 Tax=Anaeramoeba flamelloides TaxID=1746091 RepID=A0ABQ8Y7L1_9EUKA|nr:glycerol dehydrogenase [Anaeramoeba flamelloides]
MIFGGPGRYIQGANVLSKFPEYLNKFIGKKSLRSLIVGGKRSLVSCGLLMETLKENRLEYDEECFGGECCNKEIDRLSSLVSRNDYDLIIGIGGGKSIDTMKLVANLNKKPVVVVPTIASTDAPCSALSVVYSETGVFERYEFFPRSPDLVIVDTSVVAKSPPRTLVSGMGDALATYWEARACLRSGAINCLGGRTSPSSLALSRLCYDSLIEFGKQAFIDCQNQTVSTALERVVEANTLLSGVGFESGGLAAAHAIHNGFSTIPATQKFLHGEKVAFGTLVQLILDQEPKETINQVLNFCSSVNLPITLSQIGINTSKNNFITSGLRKVAEKSMAEGETIHNLPYKFDRQTIMDAILEADKLGRMWNVNHN